MELRQLRYFVAVAEMGSFSEASRRCNLTQSAISQQIKTLEEEFGTQLFHRTSHRVLLSESGEMLLPLARQLMNDANLCMERMADLNGLLTGELTIGLTNSLESLLRGPIVRFMSLYPKVRLKVVYESIPDLLRELRAGKLDMVFSLKVGGEEDWAESEPVLSYKLCAVMSATHPLASRSVVTAADLSLQRIIMSEQGLSVDYDPVADVASTDCVKSGVLPVPVRAYINDIGAILKVLRQTHCLSVLPEHIVEGEDGLRAVPIKELSQPFTSYVHFLKGGYRKRSATALLQLLPVQASK
ncbi:MAG: LysR family transcriptional regulator [Bacteroidales bacterium]|nr:LysR family transcriptional regulator [Candidatus Physcousia equi]